MTIFDNDSNHIQSISAVIAWAIPRGVYSWQERWQLKTIIQTSIHRPCVTCVEKGTFSSWHDIFFNAANCITCIQKSKVRPSIHIFPFQTVDGQHIKGMQSLLNIFNNKEDLSRMSIMSCTKYWLAFSFLLSSFLARHS